MLQIRGEKMNNEGNYARHERHMKSIREAQKTNNIIPIALDDKHIEKEEQMNSDKKELKEFCLKRTTTTYEYCYVMATDWEDAEEKGHQEEQDWESSDHTTHVEAEEQY